ncbi:putative flavoprotein [Hyaloraphidium curvatum]|nr:putative flavoprotein [Hyaloraphidium curvatum]
MPAEHFDSLIIGAGISGIAAAYHLQKELPDSTFVILEMQETFGGTWTTHKYPGIRSDSDLYTFGYKHKPWVGAPIATAGEILSYMDEVIQENGIDKHIRYRQHVSAASWSSETNTWTIQGTNRATGEAVKITCNFLWMCQGYYNHTTPYMPKWEGTENYKGQLIHAMIWPKDLDYKDKTVVVIGSGATAATVIPAMAADVKKITMLQRSPTYFIIGRNGIDIADELRKLQVDESWIHEIVRRKIIYEQALFTKRCIEEPDQVKAELLAGVKAHLPEGYDMSHFTPSYRPWQQRIAFIPDGDMFKGISSGKAEVVTDHIDKFVEDGILLKSGKTLQADIIVAATGFNLCIMGDIKFTVDGKPVDWHNTITYRGTMFTGVPNMAWVFGYFRASWTLRSDMISEFYIRLMKHMREKGFKKVVPALRPEDKDMKILPWIDEENFNPEYLKRDMDKLPQRGEKREWAHTQDYWREKDELPLIDFNGAEFVYA